MAKEIKVAKTVKVDWTAKLITGEAKILAAAKSFQTRANKLATDSHILCASALKHTVQHGDLSFLTRVYKFIPQGANRRGPGRWLANFSKDKEGTPILVWSEAKGWQINTDAKFTGKWMDNINVDGAIATPWYEMAVNRRDNQPQVYNLANDLEKVLARAHKAIDSGNVKAEQRELFLSWVRSIEQITGLNPRPVAVPAPATGVGTEPVEVSAGEMPVKARTVNKTGRAA